MSRIRTLFLFVLGLNSIAAVWAQCSISNATSCVCAVGGQTNCDLLPDMTISWKALSTVAGSAPDTPGPTEYGQSGSNAARLKISGSTPNIGKGNLEVRGVNAAGVRAFICGTDTITVSGGQQNYTCPNGVTPRQILYQRVYHKNGATMSYNDVRTGTMTYHPNHGHYHVDDWTTMTLRIQDPNEPLPTKWPIVATGAKIGFCLMDYYNCWDGSANGHCRTSQEWNGGTALTSMSSFPNNGMFRNYACGADFQGISTGRTDLYGEWLEGMWINLMPNLCNGNYWIVAEVDPTNVFREENETNNWTAMPFTLALQRAANSGGSAFIHADKRPVVAPGRTVTLTAAPGSSHLWSNGATTRSITVSAAGSYSCTVSAPCGTLVTGTLVVTALSATAPTTTGATVLGPASATLGSTGGDPQWYANETGGAPLASGPSFTTPVLSNSTTYWVSDRNTLAEESAIAGKPYVPSHGANYNGKQWLLFDAYKPFTLQSVTVFSSAVGVRHFVVVDNVGNLIAEKLIELGSGLQTVTLNFRIPAGTQHRISAYDSGAVSNSTQLVFQDLHRSTVGVSYPYPIGALGSITGSSEGPTVYHFLYDWVVKNEAVQVESARVPVLAEVTNGVVVNMKAFLEGPFDGDAGLMHDSLRVAGLIPANEPFVAMGFPQVGAVGGSLTPAALSVTGNSAIVDWVRVELRSASDPTVIVGTQSGIITRSGQVLSTSGAPLRFNLASNQNYHVALRHRNHLAAMTATPVLLNGSSALIDFSLASTAVYGTDACKVVGSSQVLWAGDAVRDGLILYTGAGNDRDRILETIGGSVPTNTAVAYSTADVNLDGKVMYTGSRNDRDLILSNIGGVVPTNSRAQQLP